MAKSRMFVVEARRLLPLLFLLVLLVSLSVYDSFRVSPAIAPEEAARKKRLALLLLIRAKERILQHSAWRQTVRSGQKLRKNGPCPFRITPISLSMK